MQFRTRLGDLRRGPGVLTGPYGQLAGAAAARALGTAPAVPSCSASAVGAPPGVCFSTTVLAPVFFAGTAFPAGAVFLAAFLGAAFPAGGLPFGRGSPASSNALAAAVFLAAVFFAGVFPAAFLAVFLAAFRASGCSGAPSGASGSASVLIAAAADTRFFAAGPGLPAAALPAAAVLFFPAVFFATMAATPSRM